MKCPCCGQEVPSIEFGGLRDLHLTIMPAAFLRELISTYPRGLSAPELYDRIYGDAECSPNIVRVYINRLRKELEPYGWGIASSYNKRFTNNQYRLEKLP